MFLKKKRVVRAVVAPSNISRWTSEPIILMTGMKYWQNREAGDGCLRFLCVIAYLYIYRVTELISIENGFFLTMRITSIHKILHL